jgi:phosphomevalonate kinase
VSRARAPGKVVVSGAYAVLEGAPAIVSAVDRYAIADASVSAELVTSEVQAAIDLGYLERAPGFDSSAQREQGRKLGVGSSAAILVASLLAMNPESPRDELFERALLAHRRAQGGGSGVDVAASVYGGTLRYVLAPGAAPTIEPLSLPSGIVIEVWSSPVEAKTSELIAHVARARAERPEEHAAILRALFETCDAALAATRENDATAFVTALREQSIGLARLGKLAGVPIRTESVRALGEHAERDRAVVMPAGAGGGDVCLYIGLGPPSPELVAQLPRVAHDRLPLHLNAPGAWAE